MTELVAALARLIAAKPHSADVERLIKSYNLIKTIDRSSLSPETVRCSLYIRHNMPVVAQYDARPAVSLWLGDRNRREVTSHKAISQPWFSTMFPEANEKAVGKNKCQTDRIEF